MGYNDIFLTLRTKVLRAPPLLGCRLRPCGGIFSVVFLAHGAWATPVLYIVGHFPLSHLTVVCTEWQSSLVARRAGCAQNAV